MFTGALARSSITFDRGLLVLVLLDGVEGVRPGVGVARLDRDGALDALLLLRRILLRLVELREVERRIRCPSSCSAPLSVPSARSSFSCAAGRRRGRAGRCRRRRARRGFAGRFRLLVAVMLHELLREDATAIEVVLRVLPVLLRATEEVLEADRDQATCSSCTCTAGPLKPRSFQTAPSSPRPGRRRPACRPAGRSGRAGSTSIALPGTPFPGNAIDGGGSPRRLAENDRLAAAFVTSVRVPCVMGRRGTQCSRRSGIWTGARPNAWICEASVR